METLKPVEVSEFYIDRVSGGMRRYFWENIFAQIFLILQDTNAVINSKEELINAIKTGRIYYDKGAFRGKFNNRISTMLEEMGAWYRNGAYYIERSLIPVEYAQTIGIVEAQTALKLAALNKYLLNLDNTDIRLEKYIEGAVEGMFKKLSVELYESAKDKNVPVISLGYVTPEIQIPRTTAKSIEKYWKDIEKQKQDIKRSGKSKDEISEEVNRLSKEAFENAPKLEIDGIKLSKESQKIAEDYVYNMQYWVKNWEVKNIAKMRKDITQMVQDGARVPTIREYFEKRWKIAKDKAHFLAVNESHLASSVIKATHYQNMGFTHFKWGRSASKEKRLLHEEYYGKVFSYSNPPIIDEKLGIKGLPRQIWNCLPGEEPIVSPFDYIRLYRRWYTGELTTLITSSGNTLNTTPNHPILTEKGWKGAGSLEVGDKIVKVKDNFIFSGCKNPNDTKIKIGELFDFFSVFGDSERVSGTTGDFHGDGIINEQVDIININSSLFFNTKTVLDKGIIQRLFTETKNTLIGFGSSTFGSFFKSLNVGGFIPQSIVSVFDQLLTFFETELTHSNNTSFMRVSRIYSHFMKSIINSGACNFEMLSDSLDTHTFNKQFLYRFIWELFILIRRSFMTNDDMSLLTHSDRQIIGMTANEFGDFSKISSFDVELDTVVDKFSCKFSNHVYNLQNVNNWYLYHNHIIKNCKCHQIPIVNADFYANAGKINNDKKNIFKQIFNSTQLNNTAWRYRRFGEG